MANPEHLSFLKQGVEIWNKWREENPRITPDLSGADLRGETLGQGDFRGADFNKTSLCKASLISANFAKANLRRADLTGANLSTTDFSDAELRAAKLKDTNFSFANLNNAKLAGADLTNANFMKANLLYATLDSATLKSANFMIANLKGAGFSDANLIYTNFEGANIEGADFVTANLSGAIFRNTITDGKTLVSSCSVDRCTDFRQTSLENIRIDSGTKELLKYNIRRLNWEDWYKNHKIARMVAKPFWWLTDYGSSTGRILTWFFVFSFMFAVAYFNNPEIVKGLEPGPEVTATGYLMAVRSLYFSIVTMTTLGFGDIHAAPGSILGHILLTIQVLLGYVMLGALITRLSILFSAEGPMGKISK